MSCVDQESEQGFGATRQAPDEPINVKYQRLVMPQQHRKNVRSHFESKQSCKTCSLLFTIQLSTNYEHKQQRNKSHTPYYNPQNQMRNKIIDAVYHVNNKDCRNRKTDKNRNPQHTKKLYKRNNWPLLLFLPFQLAQRSDLSKFILEQNLFFRHTSLADHNVRKIV